MITDKDREDARVFLEKIFSGKTDTGSWHGINDKWSESELVEMQAERDSRVRTKSADQARKEAAERVSELAGKDCFRNPGYGEGYERGLYDAYLAILADSVVKENLITDHIPDVGKKLAIAVKALEYVTSKSLPSDVFGGHYSRLQDACAKASDALKEIQG